MGRRLRAWTKDIKENRAKIGLVIIFLVTAVILNYIAGTYTTERANVREVPDLILDILPAINAGFIFVWLYIAMNIVFILYPFIFKPGKIHHYLGSFSLFIVIRAFFVTLTHLKTPTNAINVTFPWITDKLLFSNDLFFSGHVGLPFLGFLIFRKDNKLLSNLFLISSVIMAVTVLVMHQHYSIDVFAAFFITYTIYKIGNKLFNHQK